LKININTKRFIYLISPNKIHNKNLFYSELENLLKTKKIYFFQLRLKNYNKNQIIQVGKKVRFICKKYKTKLIINDNPFIAKKLNADGCHLGQKDMKLHKTKNIPKNKIFGVTCHNSRKLIRKAINLRPGYIAIGAFFKSRTKKVKYKADINLLKYVKRLTKIPVVTIGGINNKNYKKLLLNKANFLAISGYIWNNKKYKPQEAIEKLK
jgi:thiamine-phosphate pyrophosphorylase